LPALSHWSDWVQGLESLHVVPEDAGVHASTPVVQVAGRAQASSPQVHTTQCSSLEPSQSSSMLSQSESSPVGAPGTHETIPPTHVDEAMHAPIPHVEETQFSSTEPSQSSSRPLQTDSGVPLGRPGVQVSEPAEHTELRRHSPRPQVVGR
jgi:hypothetical protein